VLLVVGKEIRWAASWPTIQQCMDLTVHKDQWRTWAGTGPLLLWAAYGCGNACRKTTETIHRWCLLK
jgi:hypothetical protein